MGDLKKVNDEKLSNGHVDEIGIVAVIDEKKQLNMNMKY